MTTIAIAAVVVLLFAIAIVRAFVRSNEWPSGGDETAPANPSCPSASDDGVYACSLRAGHDGDHEYVCRRDPGDEDRAT